MNARIFRTKLTCGIDFGQRFRVLPLALIDARELVERTGQLRIELQSLLEALLGVLIFLLVVINDAELVVVVNYVWLEADVLQKFSLGAIQFLFFQIGDAKIEMQEWQL